MMDLDRIVAVVRYYQSLLRERKTVSQQHLYRRMRGGGDPAARQHALSVCERLLEMTRDEPERREKIMRWYGFLQGAMWMMGEFTVDQLKQHSSPDSPPPSYHP